MIGSESWPPLCFFGISNSWFIWLNMREDVSEIVNGSKLTHKVAITREMQGLSFKTPRAERTFIFIVFGF